MDRNSGSPSTRAELPEGEYFQADLIGCMVVERSGRDGWATVDGWQEYGGPPLMEVRANGREVLIPFVKGIYRTS